MWSWAVIGTCILFILGGGLTFMTSGHPLLADICYVFGGFLFIVKFVTWEENRRQAPKRRRLVSTIGVVMSALVTILAVWGNHKLNPAPANAASHSQITSSPSRNDMRFVGGYTVRQPELTPPSIPESALTLHLLFTEDFPQCWIPRIDTRVTIEGHENAIESGIFVAFPGRSRFVGFFLPKNVDIYRVCKVLPDAVDLLLAHFSSGHTFQANGIFDKSQTPFEDLASTGRVYVYYEGVLNLEQSAELEKLFASKHLGIVLRGDDWFRMSILQRRSPNR